MIPQYDNNLLASVFLWAEYKTLQVGQAYINLTCRLFPTVDRSLPAGYQSYSFPIKGWNYDSGVSGALVINSISGGGYSEPLTRASGVHFDYINGRAIVPTSLGTNLILTGTASVKQINHYQANESEEALLTQSKYFVNPRFINPLTASGAPPHIYATPAIFVNPVQMKNNAYAFGGLVDSKSTISLVVLAESNFQLNAVLSLFRDTRYQYFPLISIDQDPLDQWGDLKSGYNYQQYITDYGTPGNLVYIEDTYTAKLSDAAKMNQQVFAGLVDLECCYIRLPPTN